jgi:hypothetical protein
MVSRFTRMALWILIALSLPAWAASGLPPELEAVRVETVDRLGTLYAVPVEEQLRPIEIHLQEAGSAALPKEWQGMPLWAAGAAKPASGKIILFPGRMGRYPFGDLPQTLRHELSHVLLHRSLGYDPPRWLDEGLAMRAAGEWKTSDDMFSAFALLGVARGKFSIQRLEEDFRSGESKVRRSYALARAFVRDTFPDDAELTTFLMESRRLRSVDRAFNLRFGATPQQAFQAWARNLPWWGEWMVWIGSPSTLWFVVVALFIAAAFVSYRRRKRIYEQLPD